MIHSCELVDHYPETRRTRQKEETGIRHVYCLPAKEKLEQAMQCRVHQEPGNASALVTSMQLAAHPYYVQEDKADNRKGKVQRNRVGADDFSSLRLWQQGRGNKVGAWRTHPSNITLCCNGRVTAMATKAEAMTLGLRPRAKTIVSRESWATQMCWNLVNWLLQTKNPLDIQLEDERLRIDKDRCWSNESGELVRTGPVPPPTRRTQSSKASKD